MDNNPDGIAEQECMDSNTLEIVQDNQANAMQDDEFRKGGSRGPGSSHYQIAEDTMRHNETFSYRVKLPPDVTCKRCVVQWTYTTGKEQTEREVESEREWTNKFALSGRHVGGDESGHCSEIQELASLLQEIVGANVKTARRASWVADRKKFLETVPTLPLSPTRQGSLPCQRSEDGKENLRWKNRWRIMIFLIWCQIRIRL